MGARKNNVKFHKNCENTCKILKKKRQYCLNYSGTRFLSTENLMDSVLIIIVVQWAISESPQAYVSK